jgi:S-phase kinase-associated protein 1
MFLPSKNPDSSNPVIELKYISSEVVEKIVDYLVHHSKVPPKDIPKPLPTPDLASHVDAYDLKFVDVDQDTMFQTLLAANFMDIAPLLNLMCAKVASLMKGKTPEEIRKTFNIRADYTPEEEEHVRKEYQDLLE